MVVASMNGLNKPAVSMRTRRALYGLVADGTLDEASATLMERVLDKTRPASSSGWVFSLAEALGASVERALAHASFCEVICAAVDFIDDVQDGDAHNYLGDVTPPVQLNLGVHIVMVAMTMACRLDAEADLNAEHGLTGATSRLLSRMGCGQRVELARESWSTSTYESMCVLTGGCQLEIYFRAAAQAAGAEIAPWRAVAEPLGVLLHMLHDERVADQRLLSLPAPEVADLRLQTQGRLRAAMQETAGPGRAVAEQLAAYAGLPQQPQAERHGVFVSAGA
jgi:hypothetical protein